MDKQATLEKYADIISAMDVLHKSARFNQEKLFKMFDNLMGYRTFGEQLDVYAKLQEMGVFAR